jgi:hypothetical protein
MDLRVKQNWQQLFEQYLKSGLSKAEFCRSQKIPSHTFFYYPKLHGGGNQIKSDLKPSTALFIPLIEKKNFKIMINNSLSLSFESVPDASWMADFVKSLGAANART